MNNFPVKTIAFFLGVLGVVYGCFPTANATEKKHDNRTNGSPHNVTVRSDADGGAAKAISSGGHATATGGQANSVSGDSSASAVGGDGGDGGGGGAGGDVSYSEKRQAPSVGIVAPQSTTPYLKCLGWGGSSKDGSVVLGHCWIQRDAWGVRTFRELADLGLHEAAAEARCGTRLLARPFGGIDACKAAIWQALIDKDVSRVNAESSKESDSYAEPEASPEKKLPEVSASPDYQSMYLVASAEVARAETRAERAVRRAKAAEASAQQAIAEAQKASKTAQIASETARATSERIEREVVPMSKHEELRAIQRKAAAVPRVKGHYDN